MSCRTAAVQSVLEKVLADSNTSTHVGTWLAVLELASEQNQLGSQVFRVLPREAATCVVKVRPPPPLLAVDSDNGRQPFK